MEIDWQQTKKQNEAWQCLTNNETNDLVFGGGAGGGKSLLGCAWLIVMCGMYPGSRWLMGRAKLKNLKETTLNTFFEICGRWNIKNERDFKYNSQDGTITFTNGSQILLKDLFLYPSDPNFDSLGSLEITGAFVDEVNQIVFKAWSIVKSRIRYKLDEFGIIPKMLGTCNPSKGWVYTEFYKPNRDRNIEDNKRFIQALVTDNPFISPHYIKNLKSIKDKATRERLLHGNWEYDDDPACLFDYDVIQDMFTNKAKKDTTKYISGDVSRKGRDKMPIGIWKGLKLQKVILIPDEIRSSTKKSAYFIMNLAQEEGIRFSHIVLDEDGVGGGVVDNIPGCVGFVNNSAPILTRADKIKKQKGEYYQNFGNLKAQCYFKFADLAEEGKVEIGEEVFRDSKDKDDFIEDLGQIKQKDIDKDGKIYLIGKDEIKENIGRSTDFGDMAMMRMYFEVYRKPELNITSL
ncbi:MAG: hypothetical protein C4519_24325 [Desulfobacteraceae bacterium]|nr:MAG: hypothetical protein C4519_24325 [Desulfobacteraceae bacterium]